MATRRGFIASLFAASALPGVSWADAGNPGFLAAARESDGSFALYGLRSDGSDAFRVALPARGHAGAAHPTRPEAVAFARRPGDFALVLNCSTGETVARLTPPAGQYFNGHGAFSADGSVLYTVENMADTSDGIIGMWARDGWRRIGQGVSGGMGPHEILRLPGSDDLVVANGGLLTDLQTGDETRNIDTMQPSLVYLSATGKMLEQVQLPADLRRNSIRHLAARRDGLVAFAMQWQGDAGPDTPLLGLHMRGTLPQLMQAPKAEHALMQGYAGSIAFDASGARVAISSPKGGRAQVFETETGYAFSVIRADLCGLALAEGGMMITDGLGGVLALHGQDITLLAAVPRAWDNHIVAL